MSRFWLQVQDSTGVLGAGPIATAQSWAYTARLNRAGSISAEFSSLDPQADLILGHPRRQLHCYGQLVDGGPVVSLGAGVANQIEQTPTGDGNAMLRVSGPDLLWLLADRSVGNLSIVETSTALAMQVWRDTLNNDTYTDAPNLYDNNLSTDADIFTTTTERLYIGAAAVYDALIFLQNTYNNNASVIVAEFWDGADWRQLPLTDHSSDAGKTLKLFDSILFSCPSNWALKTISGVAAYYMRMHVTGALTAGTDAAEILFLRYNRPTLTGPQLIMAHAPAGWTLDTVLGSDETATAAYGQYAQSSVLQALIKLGEDRSEHFRLGIGKQVVWMQGITEGKLGNPCGVMAVWDAEPVALAGNAALCLISDLAVLQDATSVVSRIYPYGSGDGSNRLTLAKTTRSAPAGYTLSVSGNYIACTAVEADADYGQIDLPLSFKNIAPLSNTDADMANAADALFDAALAELQRRVVAQKTYKLSVSGLQALVYPGQTIHVLYQKWTDVLDNNGAVTGRRQFVDVDDDLYILEVQSKIDTSGLQVTGLVVSNAMVWPQTDGEWTAQRMEEARFMDSHPQFSLAYAPVGPYTRRMDATHPAEFAIRIGSEVVSLNHAFLRFKTGPLVSSVVTIGGTVTGTVDLPDHTHTTPDHTHGVPDHQHNITVSDGSLVYPASIAVAGANAFLNGIGMGADKLLLTNSSGSTTTPSGGGATSGDGGGATGVSLDLSGALSPDYGIYEDSAYPTLISVYIDNVDRTAELGGPWAPTDASAEAILDITAILNGASGGLRQTHTVVFGCTAIGEAPCQGEIEVEVDLFVAVQATVVF
jgi:hypothetical protein